MYSNLFSFFSVAVDKKMYAIDRITRLKIVKYKIPEFS